MNWDPSSDTKEKKSNPTGINTVNNKPKLLTKQIQSWSDVLEEIPEHVKYAYYIESLKTNTQIAKICW